MQLHYYPEHLGEDPLAEGGQEGQLRGMGRLGSGADRSKLDVDEKFSQSILCVFIPHSFGKCGCTAPELCT